MSLSGYLRSTLPTASELGVHKEYGHTIGSFVHDEQDQFIPHFTQAFELLAKFHGDSGPLSMISNIELVSSFDCTLDERNHRQREARGFNKRFGTTARTRTDTGPTPAVDNHLAQQLSESI